MHAFLTNLANRQTDRQTDRQSRAKTMTSSFVGGNNPVSAYRGLLTSFFHFYLTYMIRTKRKKVKVSGFI